MSEYNHKQDEEIRGKVSWVAWGAFIAVIVPVLGWTFAEMNRTIDKVDEAINRVSSVEGDIKEIKANVNWLREIVEGNLKKTSRSDLMILMAASSTPNAVRKK